MNMPLPRFNAFDILRDMESAKEEAKDYALATLETLAETPSVFSSLRDLILCFTDDDWLTIEERSAIMEYDGGLWRYEAEARAVMEQLAKE